MDKKKYTLTEEHRALLPAWRDKWIANAMNTKPMTDYDREQTRIAIKGLYESAGLTPPPDERIVFVPSPFVARFAGGFAAAIWWMRKNKKKNVDDATYAATRDATDDATYAATDAATREATAAATREATAAATREATYAATREATADETGKYYTSISGFLDAGKKLGVGTFGLKCAQEAWRMYQGGNFWSGWDSFLSFFKDVVKLDIDYSKYKYWQMASEHGSYRIMHHEFCIVSDRPRVLKVDDQNRPHCETGPYIQWADGMGLFAWHGTMIPKEWILDKKSITPEIALKWENAEQRRCAMEIIGWNNMLTLMGAKLIDKDEDDTVGQLYEVNHTALGGKCKFLRMYCPTGRWFAEPVPPEMKTALQANSWGWGLEDWEYKPRVQS